jgi:hypothetical protein
MKTSLALSLDVIYNSQNMVIQKSTQSGRFPEFFAFLISAIRTQ